MFGATIGTATIRTPSSGRPVENGVVPGAPIPGAMGEAIVVVVLGTVGSGAAEMVLPMGPGIAGEPKFEKVSKPTGNPVGAGTI